MSTKVLVGNPGLRERLNSIEANLNNEPLRVNDV